MDEETRRAPSIDPAEVWATLPIQTQQQVTQLLAQMAVTIWSRRFAPQPPAPAPETAPPDIAAPPPDGG